MNSRYELVIYWSGDDDCFVVEVPELPGCMADGKTYQVEFFNLDAILSVGYRVNKAGLRFYTRGMPGSEIRELIFEVREADEGGYVARALGESICADGPSCPAP